jgi:hypothetical protein
MDEKYKTDVIRRRIESICNIFFPNINMPKI